ncbi:conserved hypothetical protein [Ricinus communis]|uniref:Uncharacterized protein n=1 Tax=Ricinus communis TaxID=3988 RepID=B9SXD4_RICCO|nr:conserved hypothetical protein [Ricinus communis]
MLACGGGTWEYLALTGATLSGEETLACGLALFKQCKAFFYGRGAWEVNCK